MDRCTEESVPGPLHRLIRRAFPTLSLCWPIVQEATISLAGYRLRAFLAMLGIIIGVASVVLMLAVGNGSRRIIEEAIMALGTNQLVITPGTTVTKGLRSSDLSSFTMGDVTAIAQLPTVTNAAPATYPRNFPASYGKLNWDTPTTATTPEYLLIRNWQFTSGAGFTAADVHGNKRVAVLGATVAGKLFGNDDPTGRIFTINKMPFAIAGVLKPKGQSMDGRDQDDVVFLPITTGKTYLWGTDSTTSLVQVIYVQVASREVMDEAIDQVTQMLRKRFHLRETESDSFTVHNLTAIKQVAADTNRTFTLLLQAIASISLLVGSIGIMNIMLVTVTERTHEIGIRKAIGATKGQIMFQFLLEAVILSFVGSITGLALGFAVGLAAQNWANVPVEFSIVSVCLSLVMAAGIGVISGLYPAWKAAHMQPIDALRIPGG